MANLRANTIAGSGGSGNNIKASVHFNGTNQYLSFADNADWAMGTGDLTAECWFHVESNVDYRSIIDARDAAGDTDGWMIGVKADGNVYVYAAGWLLITTGAEGTVNTWHHVAYVRKDGTHTLYLDGVSKATSTTSKDYTTQKFAIGTVPYSLGNEDFKGYISNVHLVKGTALYTSNFDPYQVSPKSGTNTVLLCCNDSQKIEAYDVSPVVIGSGASKPTPGKFIPSNLAVPTGPVFNGDIKINSQGHMYFPTGDTTQRGRGRGVMGGFYTAPSYTTRMEYLNIQSLGNSIQFGNLSVAKIETASCSSTTRALWAGGSVPGPTTGGTKLNTIEYATIATTSNTIDFGDLTDTIRTLAGCSNGTRGVFGGGIDDPARLNTIDYVTIASAGNGADFGDLTVGRRNVSSHSSTTRGIFAGGLDAGTPYSDVIDYITIATTGNATDFGNLTAAKYGSTGCSNSTRGLIFGGKTPSTYGNTIDYITIATTGNASDFGDLTVGRVEGAGFASPTRGIMAGGEDPAVNTIDYVTIATTGNSKDFGDIFSTARSQSGSTDCHGGL